MKNRKVFLRLLLLTALILFVASTLSFAANVSNVTNLTVDVKEEKAYLEWNKVSNVSGYEVYVNIPGKGYVYAGAVSNNRVTVIGFVEGKTYSAKVRAYTYENGKKVTGGYSNEVSFGIGISNNNEKLSQVKNLKASVENTKAKLTWSKVSNAFGYEVYVNIPGRGYLCVGTVTNNNATIVGFSAGETYKIKIRAIDSDKNYGDFSEEVTIKTDGSIKIEDNEEETVKLNKVTGLKGTVTGSEVKLTWNKVSEADGYEINMKIPNYGTTVMTTTSTSRTVTGLTESGSYDTKVRAYKVVDGKKIYGEYSNIIEIYAEKKEVTKPSKVTGVTGTASGTKIKVTWDKVSEAYGYEVAIKEPGSSSYDQYNTTSTSKTISGLTEEGTYKIKVRAYKKVDGEYIYGSYSSIKSVYIEEEVTLSKVTGLKGTVTGSKVKLTWNKVSGADGYEIDMTIPGYGHTIMTTTLTSRTVSGLTETDYSYDTKVRAYKVENGKKVYGAYSSTIEVYAEKEVTKLSKVTGLTGKQTGTSTVKLTWNKVSGADGYELAVKIPGYGGAEKFETTGTEKVITGLVKDSDPYEFVVIAYKIVNGERVYGTVSNAISVYVK